MRERSPFEILGLPERFSIDEEELGRRYASLRESLHPDRHVGASPAERRAAEGLSADVNEAYGTLSDPLRRLACLLSLRGSDPFAEGDRAGMPVDFLERQMELRERLEEIEGSGDASGAAGMVAELDGEIEEEFERAGSIVDGKEGGVDGAVDAARRLRYLINCREQARRATGT